MQSSCNTVYLRNMVCFRYIIVNTLHKGDNNKMMMMIRIIIITIIINSHFNFVFNPLVSAIF
jgi:hypothetical protein